MEYTAILSSIFSAMFLILAIVAVNEAVKNHDKLALVEKDYRLLNEHCDKLQSEEERLKIEIVTLTNEYKTEVARLESKMASQQKILSDAIYSNEPLKQLGDSLLRPAEDGKTRIKVCYFNKPIVFLEDYPKYHDVGEIVVDLQKLSVSMNIGLSEHMPPELVANQIAEMIKSVVLSGWANQSLLAENKV